MSILKVATVTLALCALVAPAAEAQMTWTDQGFVNVNVGVQGGSRSLDTSTEFSLYDEPGSLTTTQDVGGGAFFDVSGGYKVWRNLAVGIGFSRVGSEADVTVSALVPDPLVTDRPRSASASVGGAQYSEVAVHLSGTWMMPVTDKVDVGFAFGPTIFLVSQDLPSALAPGDISEPGPTISQVRLASSDNTTVGVHFGVDATYLVTPRIGAGVLVRYSVGSADLEGATDSLTVGGFQIGGGVRLRF
ncbi:MAG TPA: hypothetical protein VE505_11825 [Vicinamibacterales bacterium]|nr:hypothetical protein [Vicinamibacterales bacterium]